ncbi:hypothetical protein ACOMHN_038121 [Nucella lapillus]
MVAHQNFKTLCQLEAQFRGRGIGIRQGAGRRSPPVTPPRGRARGQGDSSTAVVARGGGGARWTRAVKARGPRRATRPRYCLSPGTGARPRQVQSRRRASFGGHTRDLNRRGWRMPYLPACLQLTVLEV